jgi:beta-alanine degradation protein BauB
MTVTPSVTFTILQSGAGGVTAITQLHIWQAAIGGGAVAIPGAFSGIFGQAISGQYSHPPDEPSQRGVSMLNEETDRQIDNTRARVTRHKMAPGASTGFHRHEYDYVIVPVTDGRMRIVEGGRESVSDLTAGVSYFRPAGVEHDVINGGDRDLIFVEIELLP